MPRLWAECYATHWCDWKAPVVHGNHIVCHLQFFLVCVRIEVLMVCFAFLSMNNVEDDFKDSCNTTPPSFFFALSHFCLGSFSMYLTIVCLSLLCPAHNDKLTEATYNLNISLLSSNQCYNKLFFGKFAFRKLIF